MPTSATGRLPPTASRPRPKCGPLPGRRCQSPQWPAKIEAEGRQDLPPSRKAIPWSRPFCERADQGKPADLRPAFLLKALEGERHDMAPDRRTHNLLTCSGIQAITANQAAGGGNGIRGMAQTLAMALQALGSNTNRKDPSRNERKGASSLADSERPEFAVTGRGGGGPGPHAFHLGNKLLGGDFYRELYAIYFHHIRKSSRCLLAQFQ